MSALLHFIKWRLRLAPADVWTTEAERECLVRHAAGKLKVVEVGVWHGGTSRVLRRAMASGGTLFAIDPYEPGRLGISLPLIVARGELRRIRNGRVVWVRASGHAAARCEPIRSAAPFDFVLLDPPQTERIVRAEWDAWAPLVAPDGIVAVHDSRVSEEAPSFRPDSLDYAQRVVRRDARFEIVEEAGSMTVMRRRR